MKCRALWHVWSNIRSHFILKLILKNVFISGLLQDFACPDFFRSFRCFQREPALICEESLVTQQSHGGSPHAEASGITRPGFALMTQRAAFQDNSAVESLQTVPSRSASHQLRPGGHGPQVHHRPHLQRLHFCVRVWHFHSPLSGWCKNRNTFLHVYFEHLKLHLCHNYSLLNNKRYLMSLSLYLVRFAEI